MTVLTFGKHKGSEVSSLPESYLEWGAENLSSPKWKNEFKAELNRRESAESSMRTRLKVDAGDSEALRWFERKFFNEANAEVDESGCEWEYAPDFAHVEAESRLKSLIEELQAEVQRDERKALYLAENSFLTEAIIEQIIKTYDCNGGCLDRAQFSTQARYELALKIGRGCGSLIWD